MTINEVINNIMDQNGDADEMSAVTLKERAFKHLRQLILDGELKPGDFLTERMLVEMLGMSRTPIRSALERLDVEGLANYTPNKGLMVAEVSLRRAIDLFDFRTAMECFVVMKLAHQALNEEDKEWFEQNLLLQKSLARDKDFNNYTIADSEFHRKLSSIYENSEISHAMNQIQDKLYQIALRVLRKDTNRIQKSYEDHLAIYKSILAGNGEEAANTMKEHLEYGKQILIQ